MPISSRVSSFLGGFFTASAYYIYSPETAQNMNRSIFHKKLERVPTDSSDRFRSEVDRVQGEAKGAVDDARSSLSGESNRLSREVQDHAEKASNFVRNSADTMTRKSREGYDEVVENAEKEAPKKKSSWFGFGGK